jgi:hypothetical protein
MTGARPARKRPGIKASTLGGTSKSVLPDDVEECPGFPETFSTERTNDREASDIRSEDLLFMGSPLSLLGARILIAGAADDRLLAMMAQATRQQKPYITVANRCRTPLLLCRRYADAHDVKATTIEGDLAQTQLTGLYEMILVHYTLWFIPQPRCAFFLRNLGLSLDHGGRLILVHRHLPINQGSERATPTVDFSARILAALGTQGFRLPEDEARFRRRLETYADARRPRAVRAMNLMAVEAALAAAGFHIDERIDHDRRQTILYGGGEPTTMFTRIFVASFKG